MAKEPKLTVNDCIKLVADSPEHFARLIRVPATTVRNWRTQNKFPPRQYRIIEAAFKRKNLDVPDYLMNWDKRR